MVDKALIRSIEELGINALPAVHTMVVDGWVLRFAAGYTGRANSIYPLYPGGMDPVAKLRLCERIYTSQGLNTGFKLTEAVFPAQLDALLGEHGYEKVNPTAVQMVPLEGVALPEVNLTLQVKVAAEPTERWLQLYTVMNRVPARHWPTLKLMLARIATPTCYMILEAEGVPVASGLAVLQGEWVGLFDIVTLEGHRGRGYGTQLVSRLLRWARERGARHAYLQVVRSNAPANALYAKLGFTEAYGYWYRVKQREQ